MRPPRPPARRPWLPGALLLMLALTACSGATGTGAGGVLAGMSRAHAPTTTRIAGGRIRVAGPPGFCVQRSTRINRAGGGFVALGQCASISGNPADATTANPALLTVTAMPLDETAPASPEALERHFRQGAGKAGVESVERRGEVVLVRMRDRSPERPEALNDAYWRALYQSNGYLISLSVSSLAELPITGATGRRLLEDFLTAMQAANADSEKPDTGLLSAFNRLL